LQSGSVHDDDEARLGYGDALGRHARSIGDAGHDVDDDRSGLRRDVDQHDASRRDDGGRRTQVRQGAKSRAKAAKLLQQLQDDGSMEAKDILNTYNH